MLQRIAPAVAAAAALAVTGVAAAGNGAAPNKSSSSISPPIVVSSFTALATSGPRFGDTVTFAVSTTATSYPFVNLTCYQDGRLVAQGSAGFFGGSLGNSFGLYSPQWTGGAADCTAYLDMYWHGNWKHLASTSFHVDA